MVLSVGKGKSLLASTSSQLRQRVTNVNPTFTLVESGFPSLLPLQSAGEDALPKGSGPVIAN